MSSIDAKLVMNTERKKNAVCFRKITLHKYVSSAQGSHHSIVHIEYRQII
jgi:hypothetical protein